MITVIHPATSDHVISLIPKMNGTDLSELNILSKGKPVEAIQTALAKSVYSFCGLIDSNPVALGGVVISEPPIVWMIADSETLSRHKKSFLKESFNEVARMQAQWPLLVTHVDNRWRKSHKWLNWLGFEISKSIMLFHRPAYVMEIRRPECQNYC